MQLLVLCVCLAVASVDELRRDWQHVSDAQRARQTFHNRTTAVAVLIRHPDWISYHWMRTLVQEVAIFLVVDVATGRNELIERHDDGLFELHVNETQISDIGYKNLIWITDGQNKTSAWDKAVFFFAEIAVYFEHVWFIEGDVYIPSAHAFLYTDSLNTSADLVTKDDTILNAFTNETGWWWQHIAQQWKVPLPWYNSLSCAIRCSRRLLSELQKYAHLHGRLDFIEVIFNTLAAHAKFTTFTPATLSTVTVTRQEVLDKKIPWNFNCSDIENHPLNWFHPIKRQSEFVGECVLSGSWNASTMVQVGHL